MPVIDISVTQEFIGENSAPPYLPSTGYIQRIAPFHIFDVNVKNMIAQTTENLRAEGATGRTHLY